MTTTSKAPHHRGPSSATVVAFEMQVRELIDRWERVSGRDGGHRVEQGAGNRRGFEIEEAQHARGII